MKVFFQIKIFILVSLFFFACKGRQSGKVETIQVEDMMGRQVEVPKNVSKIVGVKAGTLRLLSYLDAADMIVGVEEIEHNYNNPYNYANPEYINLPIIGPQHGGDAELISLAGPDIIFMTYSTVNEADKLQMKTGVPVIALQYGDLGKNRETFYSALKLMAKLINKKQRADSLISFIENSISDLDQRTREITDKPKVYAGAVSFRGAHGISSTAPDYAPFEFLNIRNLAFDYQTKNNSVFIDKEKIIEWNPDKIFIDYGGWNIVKEEIKQPSLSQTLDAVKNKELYLLYPYNWYTTNYANLIIDSYFAGKVLFPAEFSDIDFTEKVDEIYRGFYKKPLYKKISEKYGTPKKVVDFNE